MNSHSDASLCITMERRETERGGEREGREDQRALAQTNCTSELTFLFFPLALLSLLSFPQTTKAFLPKMLELNHGHIVTVASSLGLFSTAGVEVSIIHNDAHTSHRSHHPKPALFSEAAGVPASTLRRGRLGPLSLVVPPPVKLRNTDEHWEPLIDSSICSSGGVGPLLGSGPGARIS